ncbi:MAG TPA: sugar ABC transporter ATP-binding protein [Terriglobales bacterium]|nr:sugar ABC transporter ATP-binding protein [Terriglobales bacterium]
MLNAETIGESTHSQMGEIILEARDIVRRYPGTVALKGVTFRAHRNCVNVVIGENGAGKSTLMKILAGAEQPTSGEIALDGRRITLRNTRDAASLGIAMVHQELAILPNLDISDNVFAGREVSGRFGILQSAQQDEATANALNRLRTPMSPRTLVGRLPLGRQQIVELARSLAHQTSVLILDEPTSALSRSESEVLFDVIADLKRHGVTLVYVSHRLSELLLLGDFFTVLRDGEVVGEAGREQVDQRWIVERMTGRSGHEPAATANLATGAETLSIKGLGLSEPAQDGTKKTLLEDVCFSASAGEILGIYGLLGSGRTELLETIAGLRGSYSGEISVKGKPVRLDSPRHASNLGVSLVPEDRKAAGIIETLSIRENISIAALGKFKVGPFVSRRREVAAIGQIAAKLKLKASDLELPITSLSGGNQQKALLARSLVRSLSILLMDEPTRGVDVGAKRELHTILRELAATGICVIFTSSEIEEVRALADRVLVLCRGRISAEVNVEKASEELLFARASAPAGGAKPR